MKINRNLFYFGTLSTIVCFCLSIIFYINDLSFLYNLFNNILAGTIVLIATSLFGYFHEKKILINKLQNNIIEISEKFRKIKYFYENIISYDEMCKDCKNNKIPKPTKAEYYKYLNNQEKEILKHIDAYIDICDSNYNDMWAMYDDLYFMFDIKKKRKTIHKLYFNYIYYDIISKMREHIFLLKKVKENIAYYDAAKKELQIIQKYVFDISENDSGFEKLENNSTITNVIRSLGKNIEIVIGNKVIYKLDNEIFKYSQKL